MSKTNRKNVGFKVSIALSLISLITLSTLLLCFFFLDTSLQNGDMVIEYNQLQNVMRGDVLYLSDDFIKNNNLKIMPIYSEGYEEIDGVLFFEGEYFGNVYLEYDGRKVKTENFSQRVENIDLYRYEMISENNDGLIPIRVNIMGAVGANKKHNYDCEMQNGDKYAILDDGLEPYLNGLGKSYEVKGQVGKSGLIKKYSRLKITVSVDAEYIKIYSREDIENRIDRVLESSLEYVERYGD